MFARFVNIDHNTPLLRPSDLREWIAANHMVHYIMDAVAALDLSVAHVSECGTGRAQYPPTMMLGLLIYCYATGTFSSRRIEALTYKNVAESTSTSTGNTTAKATSSSTRDYPRRRSNR